MSFDEEMEELERLAGQYDEKHGSGKADEIIGSLMVSHAISDQIKIFKEAKGRKIIVDIDENALDAVVIKYQ
jgi:hypothetical protein